MRLWPLFLLCLFYFWMTSPPLLLRSDLPFVVVFLRLWQSCCVFWEQAFRPLLNTGTSSTLADGGWYVSQVTERCRSLCTQFCRRLVPLFCWYDGKGEQWWLRCHVLSSTPAVLANYFPCRVRGGCDSGVVVKVAATLELLLLSQLCSGGVGVDGALWHKRISWLD